MPTSYNLLVADMSDDDRKDSSTNAKTERPTGLRALAGWLVLAAFSLAVTYPLYLQGAPSWVLMLMATMAAGLILSRFLLTPMGMIVAAIMVVYQTIETTPMIALMTVGAMYGVTIFGHLLVVSLVWGGKSPQIFKDKDVNRLAEEPLTEDYKIGVVSNLWGLYWGGIDNDYSLPVDDPKLPSNTPAPLKPLARQFAMDDERQDMFASIVADLESHLESLLKTRLGVATMRLDTNELPRRATIDSSTSLKRIKQLRKTSEKAGVDAYATLAVKPEIRVFDDKDWSGGDTEIEYEIGLRWNLGIWRLEGKANDLLDKTGAAHQEGTLPAGESLLDRLTEEIQAVAPQLRDEITAVVTLDQQPQ